MKDDKLEAIRAAAAKLDPSVSFTDEALASLSSVPRFILGTVLKGCIAYAKENGLNELTAKDMDTLNERRKKKKY